MSSDPATGLHDRPVLVIDAGMHAASIGRADVDQAGSVAVTASQDRTVRVWSTADGRLERTIRLPAGPGDIGKAYAVAITPDGAVIAAGGWTGPDGEDKSIFLFDRGGRMIQRIGDLPGVILDLAFSRDGQRLAAALFGGLRVYGSDGAGRWRELAGDAYGDRSEGVAFAADGRLATTCLDGHVRLYNADAAQLLASIAFAHARPFGLAFNPVDGRLAVGFLEAPIVGLFDGASLAELPPPDVLGLDNGNLATVAWSSDGTTLYAAGTLDAGGRAAVAAWSGGASSRRLLPAAENSVMALRPLPDGALLVAAQDPWLGVLAADGAPRWTQGPRQIDLRGQWHNLAVSVDGAEVEFGPRLGGEDGRLRFDVAALALLPATGDTRMVCPALAAHAIDLAKPALDPDEGVRSMASVPGGAGFVIGSDWWLRGFDDDGGELWRRPVPAVVWAVNVASDGRLVVAGFGDGTIRWRRVEDGAELLALFGLPDGENWVAWTPEGVYAASPGARGILRWHVNHGWDEAASAVPVSAIPETHRPDVIPHVLPLLDGAEAIKVAQLALIREAIQRETGSDVPPGARLHVLAIGVSDYGDGARHLDLVHAHRDARDLAAALRTSQGSLYAQVLVSELVDGEATRVAILRELRAMRDAMARGTGDLAIVLFSGHGTMIDADQFMLLPHGVDTRSRDALEDSALPATLFHDRIAALAEHGRVVLLLDACRSGGATAPTDRSLRAALKAPNVTILTSSSAGELSVEDDAWQNGAFTEALLEALRRGDADRDGLISVGNLSDYLTQRVPQLTGGRQRPDVEVRFDGRILVATG